VTVFDTGIPAVAKRDPDLLEALQKAAKDAANEDVTLYVNSGGRSAAHRNRLLRKAVAKYGSVASDHVRRPHPGPEDEQ
jgi:hypothetical protein